jgi:hypothetical protein
MVKKCPKGQLCMETGLIITLVVLVAIAIFFYYKYSQSNKIGSEEINTIKAQIDNEKEKTEELEQKIKSMKNKRDEDPLYLVNKTYERASNPFLPPLRSDPNQPVTSVSIRGLGVPINSPTRGYSSDYQQIGILTGGDQILPLFGKPTWNGSNKWMYYTSTDKFHMIKLPVNVNSKDCTQEYGCNEVYDGEMVNVPAYSKDYKASVYQLDAPRYIPYV